MALADEVKGSCPIHHRIGEQALVKSRQLPFMCLSKRQKIAIRNLSRIQETGCMHMLLG